MKLFTGAYAPYLDCTPEENGSLCSSNSELPIEPQARTGSLSPSLLLGRLLSGWVSYRSCSGTHK